MISILLTLLKAAQVFGAHYRILTAFISKKCLDDGLRIPEEKRIKSQGCKKTWTATAD